MSRRSARDQFSPLLLTAGGCQRCARHLLGSQVHGLGLDPPVAVLQPARGHHVDAMVQQLLEFLGEMEQIDEPTPGDDPDTPWLLRTFDQLRFHPVSAVELLDLRERARAGELEIEIEVGTFSLAEHEAWLADEAGEIDAFRAQQQDAFDAERQRWIASGELR